MIYKRFVPEGLSPLPLLYARNTSTQPETDCPYLFHPKIFSAGFVKIATGGADPIQFLLLTLG
jgi:hypothetical protein